ncbi:MAG: anti-sigma factor domain-containing protein, partial [Nitriliruptorales bacterium]
PTGRPGRPSGGRRVGRVVWGKRAAGKRAERGLRGGASTPEPDVHALAGAYTLDALPAEEAGFFEKHLASCASCREEVAGLRATAARLGSTAAERAPERLRHRVLAEIDHTRQSPGAGPPPRREPGPPRLRDLPGSRRSRRAGGWWIGLAAAVLAIATLGLGGLVARLNTRVEELEARSAQVSRVLAASDVRTVPLGGPDATRASVIVSQQEGGAVLVAEELPRLGEDQVYELWFIAADGPRPAGLFQPDENQQVVQVVTADLSGVEAVGITIEPTGGSPRPTSDPLLFGRM